MKTPAKILIVEDESIVAFNLQQRLAQMGYEVPAVAASGSETLNLAQTILPDLVLMDIHIDGQMDGIETASVLQQQRSVPVIYLTAYSEDATLDRARQTRPYGYLIKPFSERELHATIQMALERHSVEEALAHSQQLLQQALDAASMGALEIDTESRTIQSTGHTHELLGWPADKTFTLDDLLAAVEPADRPALSARLQRSLQELQAVSEEFRVRTGGQQWRWIKFDAGAWPDRRMTGVMQDISQRKLAEQKLQRLNEGLEELVKERTAALNQSVKELEAFSYSVAHDLRSPIRAMVGFSQALLQSPSLPEAQAMAQRIAEAGQNMGQLIDALLNMSRLSQAPMQLTLVSLSQIAGDIVDQLMRLDPERPAQVRVAPGMEVMADLSLVHSVLDNLLRNAWKFSAHSPVTRIEVGSEQHQGETVFFVRDNGCGFSMSLKEKIFGPFQRLHSEQEYAGSGIGLTIVQRIVMRHGGRVWAESRPGAGATFYFTLGA